MNRFTNLYYRIILLSLLFLGNICPAQAWYTGEEEFAAATLDNGILTHYNYATASNDANLITTPIEPNSNQRPVISLEITNHNCREGKSYPTYYYSPSGKKTTHKIDRPTWGIMWGYKDAYNYHSLLFRTGKSDPQGYNPPSLQYCIFTVTEGDTLLHTPWNNTPDNYTNPETDYNHLLIQPVDGGFEIFIGEEHEHRLGICADDRLFGNQAGIYIGSGAKVSMRNWVITSQQYIEHTVYRNEEEIFAHLSKSTNPYEGIYEIAISTSASTNVRLGGKYRLACIQDNHEFKLLYLSGAQRAADQWKPGMIKANLQPIDGGEIFRVTWYDANHRPLTENIKASISPKNFEIIFLSTITKLLLIKISLDDPSQPEKKLGPFRLL